MCAEVSCQCIPDCAGRECGDDGCGGNCGTCDDGDVCNGIETCDANSQCDPGVQLHCSDGNVCNGVETCDPASGCRPGNPLICDDGLFCNGAEICDPILGCLDQPDPCDETQICYEDKDDCFDNVIPTVSEWGLVILMLLLLASSKVAFGQKGADRALNNQM